MIFTYVYPTFTKFMVYPSVSSIILLEKSQFISIAFPSYKPDLMGICKSATFEAPEVVPRISRDICRFNYLHIICAQYIGIWFIHMWYILYTYVHIWICTTYVHNIYHIYIYLYTYMCNVEIYVYTHIYDMIYDNTYLSVNTRCRPRSYQWYTVTANALELISPCHFVSFDRALLD